MYALVFLSLLLNVICLYAVINLRKKLQQQSDSNDTRISEEVEELLELFSEDMKLENERLHKMILKFTEEQQQKDHSTVINETSSVESEETQIDNTSLEDHLSKDTNEVLILAQEGYNAEEIAKMLQRGKGEVELLLKFYR
ncbi:DUF6115 domain-containing protein [Fictibacillus sp. 26RED30]|uniref:DUF6115 domain-containing protein n=1 Tax=Fictibacillus sp. 26RED30 TaxID=2745877 RepID=UPI0018CDEDF3|nr:hypothetical protein [Fictibacillus sp. 26RED30]MBH0160956.1 hypothetical protein [Fictibacillus sp. 26RED30]